jgi:hypothetical protein
MQKMGVFGSSSFRVVLYMKNTQIGQIVSINGSERVGMERNDEKINP